MDLELSVDVGEVDQEQRIRVGVSDESLEDPVNDDHQGVVVQSFLELLGLPPGLRELGAGGGEGGEEGEDDPEAGHGCVRVLCVVVGVYPRIILVWVDPPDCDHCWPLTDWLLRPSGVTHLDTAPRSQEPGDARRPRGTPGGQRGGD